MTNKKIETLSELEDLILSLADKHIQVQVDDAGYTYVANLRVFSHFLKNEIYNKFIEKKSKKK